MVETQSQETSIVLRRASSQQTISDQNLRLPVEAHHANGALIHGSVPKDLQFSLPDGTSLLRRSPFHLLRLSLVSSTA